MILHCAEHTLDLSTPAVMGILNVSPDSFYSSSAITSEKVLLKQAEKMLNEGAALLDVGGMSTRPGAENISLDEEVHRALPALDALHRYFPHALLSIDTFRSRVAERAFAAGACMVNDISGGRFDQEMLQTVAKGKAAFVAMHIQGTPTTMQQNPLYENVRNEVFDFLKQRIQACNEAGIMNVVIDPGFGFGKTVAHNFTLLRNLSEFKKLEVPVLVGLSRKSMICKMLRVNPAQALNGTTAAHTLALLNGADILRVHDVKEAMETIKMVRGYMDVIL